MGIKKGTLFFESYGYGWSESFFLDDNDDVDSALIKLDKLAKLRAALCGWGVILSGQRVEDLANPNATAISGKRYYVVGEDFKIPNGADKKINIAVDPPIVQEADSAYVAWKVRLESPESVGPPAIPKRHTILYLRGVPDAMNQLGGVPVTPAAWTAAFAAWSKEITNWGHVATVREFGASTAIHSWDFTGGIVRITLTAADTFAVGDVLKVRLAKVVSQKFRPNKLYRVFAVDGTSKILDLVRLDGSLNTFPSGCVVGGGFAQHVTTSQVVRKFNLAILGKETSRRTGRPFDAPRGRRSARR
jgi:hypothetical protein